MSKRRSKQYDKLIIALLAIVVVGLIGLCAFLMSRGDKNPPSMEIDEEYLKTCDLNDTAAILKAVTAHDNESEDVDVMIADINDFDGVFKINFVARDKAGNTITKSVVVNNDTVLASKDYDVIETEASTETAIIQTTKAAAETEEDTDASEDGTDEAEEDTDASEESTEDIEEESAEESSAASDNEAPVITLVTNRVRLNVGENFNYLRYIDTIKDDKDDENDLSKRIRLSGDYNTSAAGTYEIGYWVSDSDGNKSSVKILTLIVEE